MELPQSAIELIESGPLVHLTTLNPDGSPQVTVVWIGLDAGEIVMAHIPEHRKVHNIRNDPRVAMSMIGGGISDFGLREYLVIYGRARITEGGAPELLQQLAHVYLGAGVKFPPIEDPPPGYITRVEVERISGIGPWTGRHT